jgi:arsenite methyltransferase
MDVCTTGSKAIVHAGETVLDVGCGAGMDLLLAAKRTGSKGHAIGVDMTEAMVEPGSCTAPAMTLPG